MATAAAPSGMHPAAVAIAPPARRAWSITLA
jgi:hypothetical protein